MQGTGVNTSVGKETKELVVSVELSQSVLDAAS
jgi:hypothetical protein